MSVYAIGDLQGCYDSLQRLLIKINFNPENDTLWFTGDLVNRGNKSLKTLRFIKSLGDTAITVLGNHDLHLLAVANGVKKQGQRDTLRKILAANDSEELLLWLRSRPLLHVDNNLGYAMVHAGIPPGWSLKQAGKHAAEVERFLLSDNYLDLLSSMYGNNPGKWKKSLRGKKRLRFIINGFTRMRFCSKDGGLNLQAKGNPKNSRKALIPWFLVPDRKKLDVRIIFGHWSALGFMETDSVIALDTGCVWGGKLTAIKLKKKGIKKISIKCAKKYGR